MKIVLFETSVWQDLLPITHTRFMHELVVGVYSNEERVQRVSDLCVEYLIPRLEDIPYNELSSNFNNQLFTLDNSSEEIIVWNSSFVFKEHFIKELPLNTGICSLNNTWIAFKVNTITHENINILYREELLSNITWHSVEIQEIRSYEQLICGVQSIVDEDMELYLSDHKEFVEIQSNVFVHPQAKLRNSIDFDTSQGKIIIGAETKITAFTLIEGPVFIGSQCLITKAFIRPKTVILNFCRVGGELSLSTMNAYSNKAHDGCIALSYIGSWVNLGASTECATLKYTYTPLSFQVLQKTTKTSMIGCGTIFCDWTATGVGIILPPATIVGTGAVLHDSFRAVKKYTKPFAWADNDSLWDIHKWIETACIKMQRRQLELSSSAKKFYLELFKFLS